MIKKIMTCLIIALCFQFILPISQNIALAQQIKTEKVQNQQFILTDEQKAKLQAKKEELKEKYLKHYDKMTDKQKERAKEQFREELRAYCEDELGLKFDAKQFERKVKKHRFRFGF